MVLPNPGQLLIAPPRMTDPRFNQSVLLLTHHFDGGSFACCINKPTSFTLEDISRELNLDTTLHFPLYWGGPVQLNSIWMLHSPEWRIENTIPINDNWALTSHQAMFWHIADGDTPNYFRFLHGFCSWGPGQLEGELRGTPPWTPQSSWLVTEDPGPDWVLDKPEYELWETATEMCTSQAVDSWL